MKYWFAAFLAFFVMTGAGCAVFSRPSTDPASLPASQTESISGLIGVVETSDESVRTFAVVLPDESVEELTYGEGIDLSGLKPGMLVRVDGTRDRSTRIIRASVVSIEQTFGIRLTSPTAGATVTSPLVAFGFAKAPLGRVEWRLRDFTGLSRAEGSVPVLTVGENGFGPFRLDAFIPAFSQTSFSLELSIHEKDGTEQATVSVPLTLLSTRTVTFNVFYPNNREGSSRDCSLVFPVSRTIAETSAVSRAALVEFLKGPTKAEREAGAFAPFPNGVALQSLSVNDETAVADFSRPLSSVSDACRLAALRAGIAQTLVQFPSIRSVDVTVDGEDIPKLQP